MMGSGEKNSNDLQTLAAALLIALRVPAGCADPDASPDPCNGAAVLCLQRHERVAQATTHNAMSRRARECASVSGQPPTSLVVDFYSIGDLMKVVDRLNGL